MKKIICNITRCCTEKCSFCAVDALCPESQSPEDCANLANEEVICGRELSESKWMNILSELISTAKHDDIQVDLSGGDCLSLPWVWKRCIPYLVKSIGAENVAVTAPAKSLKKWLELLAKTPKMLRPTSVHVTYDGSREYGEENLALFTLIKACGMEIHVECPISVENFNKAEFVYNRLMKAGVSEITLIRYFPTGRGSDIAEHMEPSVDVYKLAIANYLSLSSINPAGPLIKLQCALKSFHPDSNGTTPCKMGGDSLCVMPNGTLLSCPWAYGMNGNPLAQKFVAGNLSNENFDICYERVSWLSEVLRKQYPTECRVCAFVAGQRNIDIPLLLAS